MMSSGTHYEQRDVVLIKYPFSDLSGTKLRPAVIISNQRHNGINEDYIFCALTSNQREWVHAIDLTDGDLENNGKMPFLSKIKPTKVMALHKNLINKRLAKINKAKCQEIIIALSDILKQI